MQVRTRHLYTRTDCLNAIRSGTFSQCLTKERSDVLELWPGKDMPNGSIYHWLQPWQEMWWNAGECQIAVVQPREYERWHQRLKNRSRHWPTDSPQLTQYRVAGRYRFGHVRPHRDITVDVYSEVSNGRSWWNMVGANPERWMWQQCLRAFLTQLCISTHWPVWYVEYVIGSEVGTKTCLSTPDINFWSQYEISLTQNYLYHKTFQIVKCGTTWIIPEETWMTCIVLPCQRRVVHVVTVERFV